MKKGLFIFLVILTLGTIKVSADAAPPILVGKEIRIQLKETADTNKVLESIQNVDGVYKAELTTPQVCEVCQKCEECKTTACEGLSESDIKSLKTTTYIIYFTLAVLLILMIILVALLISKRKKDSKKDA